MLQEKKKVQNLKVELTEQEELIKINLLIPRLCISGHLTTAIRLITTTSLVATKQPKSISLSILIHSLTCQTEIDHMAKSMSLLTILRKNNNPYLTPITTMFINRYLKNKRPKEAFKVYKWIRMLRPGSGSQFIVNGFCEFGLNFEALMVLRDMVAVGFVPGPLLKTRVFRSLLKDGRVNEAVAFNQLISHSNNDADNLLLLPFLDSIIGSWND